jgi:hypothetical protein
MADLRQMKYETEVPFGQKTAGFDSIVNTPNPVWDDEAFEAPASEDIDIMGAQGEDSDTLGMGQTTVPGVDPSAVPPAATPAPAPDPSQDTGMSTSTKIGFAIFVGCLAALGWSAFHMPKD